MSSKENQKRTEINDLGEFGLIDRLTAGFQLKNTSSLIGVGDDAAVIDNGDEMTVVSTDLLIEGIHFDLMYHPLKHLGYKSVVVNLSDIYAMNAIPSQITFSIALSNRFSLEAVEEIYAGIHLACERYGIDLVGGDTSASHKGLIISVTALGSIAKDKLVYRNGASVGDLICVTGDLGGAYLGLQLLEREKQIFLSNNQIQPDLEGQDYIVGRQLKPEARKDIIAHFANIDFLPTAMIDVSDGLASDLMHICKASGVGGYIEEANIPIREESEQMAVKFSLDPVMCAMNGGEDYELLFTIRPEDVDRIKSIPDVSILGDIVDQKDGTKLHSTGGNIYPLKAQGWQHFGDATT